MAKTFSRSGVFAVGGGLLLLLALGSGLFLTLGQRPTREPFYGTHQAGIATPGQKFAFVAAFDVTAGSAAEIRRLLQTWTQAASRLSQGLPLEPLQTGTSPSADTGETLGYKPARLTFTFGVGPSLFDGRFGLADQRPAGLMPLPAFPGDNLHPDWSDGDLIVQVGADDFQTAYHALHNLTRLAKGVAVARWVQSGFQPGLEVNPQGPGRNLEGFIDGTVNPDTSKPEVLDQQVWVDQGPEWMKGGSYLVVRRIRMFVETWDRSTLADQEKTIGRDRPHGKELPTQAEDSHVRLARGAGVEKILRRPFSYVNGLDGRTGQWDSGLLFLAWMKDVGRQYVPMQTRISSYDALNEYIQPVGSAVFAVFPGVAEGDFVGSGLFPAPTLSQRIEGLQAKIGALYGPLGRKDWTALRAAVLEWNHAWKAEKSDAGSRGPEIEALVEAWTASLAPAQPDVIVVRGVQASLVRALSAWQTTVAPVKVSATSLQSLVAALAQTTKALAASDPAAARKAFGDFQQEWTVKEALVRNLDSQVYAGVELGTGAARRALLADHPGPEAVAAVANLERLVGSLRTPQAFSGWDVGLLLFREGLEALLVLAALLAFLGRTDQKRRQPWVWAGAGLGLAGSVGIAVLVSLLMTGVASSAPELVEGLTGLVAVVLMLTVGAWLHGKAAVKNWNLWLKERMNKVGNSTWALGTLAFLAVLREGAETVVFLWGMAGALPLGDLLAGIAGGVGVLAVLGVVLIGFSKRLPLQVFFPLATALIYFLAVKILGQSLASLQSSGWWGATPLGFAGPVGWLGFTPTWETALPQLVLALVLGALLVRSLLKGAKKKA